MHIAGLLHDLGKLAVDEEILEKPGPLSPREFAVIKQHPYFTYHILRDAGYQEISEWAAFHHEKLDGSGYPFHLTGSELSVPVRIMSLSDIYVALREPRPYRSGLDHESAVAILRKEAAARRIDCELTQVVYAIGGVLLEAAASRARAGVSSFR
ncbi:MAG: HD domain-containing phosphohydrolase [Bacillota bacterium]|nr:HD domain-containing phosphohydrolase [Bacillota bacterium]